MWSTFKRGDERECLDFEEFLFALCNYKRAYILLDSSCRSGAEGQDRFIFDLFNLGFKKQAPVKKTTLKKEEITTMLYNLPPNTVIKSKWKNVGGGKLDSDGKMLKSFMSMAGVAQDDATSKKSIRSLKESHMELDFYSKSGRS